MKFLPIFSVFLFTILKASEARHVVNSLEWVDASQSTLKSLAKTQSLVPGGRAVNGNALYICRVIEAGRRLVIPGKLDPEDGRCAVAGLRLSDKKEVKYPTNYQVLVNSKPNRPYRWQRPVGNSSTFPPGAAEAAGKEIANNGSQRIFYIGRLDHQGDEWSTQLGRIDEAGGKLYYSFIRKVYNVTAPKYQILMNPVEEVKEIPVNWVWATKANLTQIHNMVQSGINNGYVCRSTEEPFIPGNLNFTSGICWVVVKHIEKKLKSNYQVLSLPNKEHIWKTFKAGERIPDDAILVSNSGSLRYGPPFIIGRHPKNYAIGRIDPLGSLGLFYAVMDPKKWKEAYSKDFDVLVLEKPRT